MKKSLATLLLALVLLVVGVAPAFASDYTFYYVKTNNGGPLLVRSGPGKNYSKLGRLSYGEKVAVEYIENGWASIVYGSVGSAYVYAGCLSRTKPSSKKTTTSTTENYSNFTTTNYTAKVVPSNNYVNLRWAPSKSAKVQRVYFLNDTLTVIAEGKTWCQVYDADRGVCGFMQKALLVKVDD